MATSSRQPLLGVRDHRPELEHPEGRPPWPARRCLKSDRPARLELIATAMAGAGPVSRSTSAQRPTRRCRCAAWSIVERDVSQVRNSISGSSARWLRSTAVPSIARSGGTTLSLTPVGGTRRRSRRASPRRGRWWRDDHPLGGPVGIVAFSHRVDGAKLEALGEHEMVAVLQTSFRPTASARAPSPTTIVRSGGTTLARRASCGPETQRR